MRPVVLHGIALRFLILEQQVRCDFRWLAPRRRPKLSKSLSAILKRGMKAPDASANRTSKNSRSTEWIIKTNCNACLTSVATQGSGAPLEMPLGGAQATFEYRRVSSTANSTAGRSNFRV